MNLARASAADDCSSGESYFARLLQIVTIIGVKYEIKLDPKRNKTYFIHSIIANFNENLKYFKQKFD